MTEKDIKAIEKIEEEIKKIDNKENNIFFFVIDSKGNPTGSLSYVYDTAYVLYEKGYNVSLLHQEEEFVGVEEWLGEKYASLPHFNVNSGSVEISPSDLLIIPEIFSNIMSQTKDLPCKRIALLQNFNYITEFIPLGVQWGDYGIYDAISTSEIQANMIKDVFPYVKTRIVSPAVQNYFREGVEPKKLFINIVSKNQTDVNKIVKPFYWKFPSFKWVSFRDLRGLPKEAFADALREAAITVWIDDDTNFGYAPLEAMKSGNIVIGKIPSIIPEWMMNDDKTDLNDAGVWFSNYQEVHKIIASVVRAWISDEVPEDLFESMKKIDNKYSVEAQKEQIVNVYGEYINNRKAELEALANQIKSKDETNNEVEKEDK